MWKNAPSPPNIEHHPQLEALPKILEEAEIPDIPDKTLEDDLLGLEDDLANTFMGLPPENPPENEGAHLQDAVDVEKASDSAVFIEDFPANLGAGAVWGEDVPYFEKLWQKQEENQSSRWGPFEDEDEWELAKWLISNVGHKQINAFSSLKIVGSHRFGKLESDI